MPKKEKRRFFLVLNFCKIWFFKNQIFLRKLYQKQSFWTDKNVEILSTFFPRDPQGFWSWAGFKNKFIICLFILRKQREINFQFS